MKQPQSANPQGERREPRTKPRSPLIAVGILFVVFAVLGVALYIGLGRWTIGIVSSQADRTEQALRQILSRNDAAARDFEPVLSNADGLIFGLVLDSANRPLLAWETRDESVRAFIASKPVLNRRIAEFRSGAQEPDNGTKTLEGFLPRSFSTPDHRVFLLFQPIRILVPIAVLMLVAFLFTAVVVLLRSVPVRTETFGRSSEPLPPAAPPLQKPSAPFRRTREELRTSSDLEKLSFFREVALATNALTDLPSMLKTLCGVFAAKFPERNIVFFLNAGSSDDLLRPVSGLIGGRVVDGAELVRAGYEETDMDSAWTLCEDKSDPERIRVPLKDEDTLYGFILLEARDPGDELPGVEELHFVSRQVALAVRNSALYREAITDGLTGLFVHKYFQMKLEEEVRRFRRTRHPFCVFLMDIDNFKRFNDNFGHQAGDFVLRELAAIVRSTVRVSDLSFRYGGEELAVIFPETGLKDGRAASEKIRLAIAEHEFIYKNDAGQESRFRVTISGGVTAAEEGLAGKAIVEQCDRALYRAKAEGKNRVLEGELPA
jgi:diguanylate cyclase (GGDEF)-like protein